MAPTTDARAALISAADLYFWGTIGSTNRILLFGAMVEYFNPFEWLKEKQHQSWRTTCRTRFERPLTRPFLYGQVWWAAPFISISS